jgi:FixJ family two-component response regulator
MADQPPLVLVIDDDPSMVRSVSRLLAVHGFITKTFSSAEAFLAGTSNTDAACLLLDIHLGGISGFELNRTLCALGSKLPVIFMTAVYDDATEQEAIRTGCVAYLRKPFSASQLLEAIKKAAA